MSNTKHFTDSLSAYLDGALNPMERAQVDAHLAVCAQCREDLAGMRYAVAMMRALPDMRAPRSFTLSADMAARARPVWRFGWLYNSLRGFAAVAAVLLVLITSADLLTLNRQGGFGAAAPAPAVMSLPEHSQTGAPPADQAGNQTKSSATTAAAVPSSGAAASTASAAQPAGAPAGASTSLPAPLPPQAAQSAPATASAPGAADARTTGTPVGVARSAAAAATATAVVTPTATAQPTAAPTLPLSVTITLFPTVPAPSANTASPAPAEPLRPVEIGLLGALLVCAVGALVLRSTRR